LDNSYFSLTMNSDENMMDAYNLAVCFGPSVIDIPNHANPVMCQANINNVIKVFLHHSIPAFHVQSHSDNDRMRRRHLPWTFGRAIVWAARGHDRQWFWRQHVVSGRFGFQSRLAAVEPPNKLELVEIFADRDDLIGLADFGSKHLSVSRRKRTDHEIEHSSSWVWR